MKFLWWSACVTISLVGLQLSFEARDGWRWFWYPMLGIWFFAGLALVVARVVKFAAGKVGAGGLLPKNQALGQAAGPSARKE